MRPAYGARTTARNAPSHITNLTRSKCLYLRVGRSRLPDGVVDSTVLWLPEEGGFGPHLKIRRSYRSLEQSIYLTEHVFEGAEPGDAMITLAPKQGSEAVHEDRITLTFQVEP